MSDKKLEYVLFQGPVLVKGLGLVDRVDLRIDVDTGAPKTAQTHLTLVKDLGVIRITNLAGESWVPVTFVASMLPLLEDLLAASKATAGLAPQNKPNATKKAPPGSM